MGNEVLGEKYTDYPDLINDVKDAIQEVVEEQITLFGSGMKGSHRGCQE